VRPEERLEVALHELRNDDVVLLVIGSGVRVSIRLRVRVRFSVRSGSGSELAFGFGLGSGFAFGLDGVVRLGCRPTEEHADVRVAQVAEQSPLLEQQRARHLALLLVRVLVDHLAGDCHAAPRALDHDPKGASADLAAQRLVRARVPLGWCWGLRLALRLRLG